MATGIARAQSNSEGLFLVSPGGLHGDQMHVMGLTEIGQRSNAFRGVGEGSRQSLLADANIQRIQRNIHSTNHAIRSTIESRLAGSR